MGEDLGDELSRILDRLEKLDGKFDRFSNSVVERLAILEAQKVAERQEKAETRLLEIEKANERVKAYVAIAGAVAGTVGAVVAGVVVKTFHL